MATEGSKKVYLKNLLKWIAGSGLAGLTGILLFSYLSSVGALTINSYEWSRACAGTPQDKCWATVNFTVNNDTFIYPSDNWSYMFGTNQSIKNLHVYRQWGNGWREINLNATCTGTWCGAPNSKGAAYAFALRKGKNYVFNFTVEKDNPYETIKWGFEKLDPEWKGNAEVELISESSGLTGGKAYLKIMPNKNHTMKFSEINGWVEKVSPGAKDVTEYKVRMGTNKSHTETTERWTPKLECTNTTATANGTKYNKTSCVDNGYSTTDKKTVWAIEYLDTSSKSQSINAVQKEPVYVEITGKWPAQLGNVIYRWRLNISNWVSPYDWWSGTWKLAKNIDMNSTITGLTNYQVRMEINITDELNNGKIYSDCGDVRFVKVTTEMPYFIEVCQKGKNSIFWVKADALNETITMYYNSTTVTTTSSTNSTFDLYWYPSNYVGWEIFVDVNYPAACKMQEDLINKRLNFTNCLRAGWGWKYNITTGAMVNYSMEYVVSFTSLPANGIGMGTGPNDGGNCISGVNEAHKETYGIHHTMTWPSIAHGGGISYIKWDRSNADAGVLFGQNTVYYIRAIRAGTVINTTTYSDKERATKVFSQQSTYTSATRSFTNFNLILADESDGGNLGTVTGWISNFSLGKYSGNGILYTVGSEQSAPSPYNITDCANITASGSYHLDNSITKAAFYNASCINITASDVDFDCQSYSITGPNVVDTKGISAVGLSTARLTNITVRNCYVTHWYSGIEIGNIQNSSVINNTFFQHTFGAEAKGPQIGTSNTKHVNIINNSVTGLGLYGATGAAFLYVYNNSFEGFEADDLSNWDWGIYLDNTADDNLLIGNHISHYLYWNVRLEAASNNTFIDNDIYFYYGQGIGYFILDYSGNTSRYNVIRGGNITMPFNNAFVDFYSGANNHNEFSDITLHGTGANGVYNFVFDGDSQNITVLNISWGTTLEDFTSGTMYRKWHVEVTAYNITEANGNELSGANISAYNKTFNMQGSKTSNGNGKTKFNLTEYFVNSTKKYYSNYTINASYGGTSSSSFDAYSCEGSFDGVHECELAVDGDFSTYASTTGGGITKNWTVLPLTAVPNLTIKYFLLGVMINITCYNYTLGDLSQLYTQDGGGTTTKYLIIPPECMQNPVRVKAKFNITGELVGGRYYESTLALQNVSIEKLIGITEINITNDTKLNVTLNVTEQLCECPAINTNWNPLWSDYCVVNAECDLGTGILIINGTTGGNFTANAAIYSRGRRVQIPTSGTFKIYNSSNLLIR